MQTTEIKRVSAAILVWLLLPVVCLAGPDQASEDDSKSGPSATIIGKFLEATQTYEDALRGASMQVSIDASIPKLKEHGTLRALRKISKVGTVTYRVLGFQGDNTVKNEVIARYLQAEQQGQGDQSIAISPENYKFKMKGRKQVDNSREVYVFQLTPRKKKIGLFKGEMWLDAKTSLPVLEKGRLVKNPSIWFKKVDFQRDFAIQNGVAVPEHMSSTIEVRLIGTVQLTIDYSDYEQNSDADESVQQQSVAMTGAAAQ